MFHLHKYTMLPAPQNRGVGRLRSIRPSPLWQHGTAGSGGVYPGEAQGVHLVNGQHEDAAAAERRQMQRKHVFVVNGAAEFLDIVRVILEEERYNVTTTNFLPGTFEQLGALKPDAIIIDLAVGRLAGWELLERLHADAVMHNIPVVLTSTDPRLLARAVEQAGRYGEHRSVAKPLDIDELLGAVRDLIGSAD